MTRGKISDKMAARWFALPFVLLPVILVRALLTGLQAGYDIARDDVLELPLIIKTWFKWWGGQ